MDEDEFSGFELGPKMLACTARERRFVWYYLTEANQNATEAARLAGYPDNGKTGIRVRAHELTHRDRVIEAMEEVGRTAFRGLLIPAVLATRNLIENAKHPDHARTVQSTLSRLGLSERTGLDVNVSGNVTINHTDQAIETLRTLRALGVPREKLIETFGFSGLDRYEKMLAAADAKVKVIEHRADEAAGG